MKIAILTSSVGTVSPAEYNIKYDSADYFAFVESKLPSNSIWNELPISKFSCDIKYANRRHAKIYKVLPHLFVPGYDYYIWIDATHSVNQEPKSIVEKYLKDSDIALFKHPERNCVYEEAELIKKIKFDYPTLVSRQMSFYKSKEYPRNNGLYELPCRIQRNTSQINTLMLSWWEQICMFASRDQLSMPFVLNMHGIKPSIMPGKANTIWGNDIFPQVISAYHKR